MKFLGYPIVNRLLRAGSEQFSASNLAPNDCPTKFKMVATQHVERSTNRPGNVHHLLIYALNYIIKSISRLKALESLLNYTVLYIKQFFSRKLDIDLVNKYVLTIKIWYKVLYIMQMQLLYSSKHLIRKRMGT